MVTPQHTQHQEHYLQPIYILNRTTVNPEHFDAIKHAATPTTTLGMSPTTRTALLFVTEPPAPPPVRCKPPPTIVRSTPPPPPGVRPNRDSPHPSPDQTMATFSPPDDQPERQYTTRSATTQTRRRPRTQITSTPYPKKSHNPHKTSAAIECTNWTRWSQCAVAGARRGEAQIWRCLEIAKRSGK